MSPDSDVRIAELISARLQSGLVWPGDPDKELPPKPIILPIFRTVGQPQEVADLVNETAKMLGEAIVHLIRSDGGMELVPADSMTAHRTREERAEVAGVASRPTPVHCRCDVDFNDPLMILTIDDGPRIVTDGGQLIAGLSRRGVECPHRMESK